MGTAAARAGRCPDRPPMFAAQRTESLGCSCCADRRGLEGARARGRVRIGAETGPILAVTLRPAAPSRPPGVQERNAANKESADDRRCGALGRIRPSITPMPTTSRRTTSRVRWRQVYRRQPDRPPHSSRRSGQDTVVHLAADIRAESPWELTSRTNRLSMAARRRAEGLHRSTKFVQYARIAITAHRRRWARHWGVTGTPRLSSTHIRIGWLPDGDDPTFSPRAFAVAVIP
jgi:hypothetical protein